MFLLKKYSYFPSLLPLRPNLPKWLTKKEDGIEMEVEKESSKTDSSFSLNQILSILEEQQNISSVRKK